MKLTDILTKFWKWLWNIFKNVDVEPPNFNEIPVTTNNPEIPNTSTPFPIGYYMDQNHPITQNVLNEFKKIGVTDVYVRMSTNGTYGPTIEQIKSLGWQKLIEDNGMKMTAWVWDGYPSNLAAQLAELGIPVHLDAEEDAYNMPNKIPYLTEMWNAIHAKVNGIFEICTKATGWDGDMRYDLLSKICDYIVPMLYIGDYGQNITGLINFIKKWSNLYPGKFKVALETYESDANPVAKSADKIRAEIEAVKPYCEGVVLFRYGLSNFNGGITGTTNTTTLPSTNTTPTPPTTLTGWVLTGMFTQDYQDTGYTCGPSSLSMVLSALGITASESNLAVAAWTNTSGTGHDGLRNATKTYAPNVTMTEHSGSSIGGWDGVAKKLNEGCEFIIHIWTGTLPNWSEGYGHYIFLQGVNVDTQTVRIFDPIKGNVEYSYNVINQAIANISQNSYLMFCK